MYLRRLNNHNTSHLTQGDDAVGEQHSSLIDKVQAGMETVAEKLAVGWIWICTKPHEIEPTKPNLEIPPTI